MGLDIMSGSMSNMKDSPLVAEFLSSLTNPFLGDTPWYGHHGNYSEFFCNRQYPSSDGTAGSDGASDLLSISFWGVILVPVCPHCWHL